MLGLYVRDDLYEELYVVFKQYGFDFTRYEIDEDVNTNCTRIRMYFEVYRKPYGLSYEWSQSALKSLVT